MAFSAYRGSPFNHSHENLAFNALYDKLSVEWEDRDEQLLLFGNFFVAGKEFDALIVKNNAIIVIDFKNFGGVLTFSENGPWKCDDAVVKGGNSRNPFLQIRSNKFALLDYVKSGQIELLSQPNLGHIAGLVVFHQPIQVDESKIPQQVKSWFHICDLDRVLRTIDAIASASISLTDKDLNRFVEAFDAPEYFPDGKPSTRQISTVDGNDKNIEFVPLGSQKEALEAANVWLASKECALVLKGMSSTGKRSLLCELLNRLSEANKSVLLLTPNARLAKQYSALGRGEFTSIYQSLYSNKSDGVIKKSNGVELARHPVILTSEQVQEKIVVIVEAHLISNSYYDMDSSIFGTGYMVNDLLNAFGDQPPKLLIVGDPYQLSRGNLDQSLLSGQAIKDKEFGLTEVVLTQQIESEPKALHEFQFDLAQQMQIKQFNQLPKANNDVVKKIDNSSLIGQEITTGRFHAVYLCALNDVAHKINIAVKQRVLQQSEPHLLCIGDLVDFHTSATAISLHNDSLEDITSWVNSGEIASVSAVSANIEVIEFLLKGRDSPTQVRIGEFTCRLPSMGEVRLKYLVDYLHAEKPELTQDQMLVLSIVARQRAEEQFSDLKAKVRQLKDTQSPEYSAENKKYNELVQNNIAYSPLLNAARIRYAYAMTVHRAQGRTWNNVYLDASRGSSGDALTNDGYFRFLYTASMCAESELNLLKYPNLTPLYQCQFIPKNDCKVGPFEISKGFNFAIPDVKTLEAFIPPMGFSSDVIELKALSYALSQKLQGSHWRLCEVKQHSFQELYSAENAAGNRLKIRFHYDKNLTVTNVVYLEENSDTAKVNELKDLLETSPTLSEPRLNNALLAIKEFFAERGFELITAKMRSEWEFLVGLANENEAIELKFYVTKDGLISKAMPEKASSNALIELIKGMLNEQ